MWAKLATSVKVVEEEIDKKETDNDDETETLHDPEDDLLTLNVGGTKHQTRLSTLKRLKNTRLTEIAEKAKESGKREFFFDRQPDFFPYILNFYRTGRLHIPTNICGPMAKDELNYWKIDDKDIQQCCWVHYINYEDTMDMVDRFEKDEHHARRATKAISASAPFFQRLRPKLWRGLQEPASSTLATVFALVSFSVVCLSIIVFIIETLPYFDSIAVHQHNNITNEDIREEFNIFNMSDRNQYHILLIIDHCCNMFFFSEFILKFTASPRKGKFMKTPMTIIELLCLIPYYLAVMIVYFHSDPKRVFMFIRILFATRLLRIFRIFVLMKHNLALKVLVYTIKASTRELLLLLLVFFIGVVIFASLEFYLEVFGAADDKEIDHIPTALWWALITMTTVGYGDFVPKSGPGYALGAICATSGVLVIALSVPAIVNNFTLYYLHAKCRIKLKERKRKFHLNIWQRVRNNARKSKEVNAPDKNGMLTLLAGAMKNNKPSKTPVKPMNDTADDKGKTSSASVKNESEETDKIDTRDKNTKTPSPKPNGKLSWELDKLSTAKEAEQGRNSEPKGDLTSVNDPSLIEDVTKVDTTV